MPLSGSTARIAERSLASNEQLAAELYDRERDVWKFPVEAFLLLADKDLLEDYYDKKGEA